MWVCGLKPQYNTRTCAYIMSHPMWVCGLKHARVSAAAAGGVAPYVGVWIETPLQTIDWGLSIVAPYVGVWIETSALLRQDGWKGVAPYVGVWIETKAKAAKVETQASHPMWVCGLKR